MGGFRLRYFLMNKIKLAIFCLISLLLMTCQAVRAQKRMPRQSVDFESIGPIRVRHATASDPPVEERFKNIRVLQGLPSSQLIPVMGFMANSLGVTCSHCHTAHFDEDQLPEKKQAREMIRMTRAINAGQFNGQVMVTCNSCHKGQLYPNPLPDLAAAGWRQAPAKPAEVALPSADAVVSRFAGMRISGFHGTGEVRVIRGSETLSPAPIRIDISAPNQVMLQSEARLREGLSRALGHWFALESDLARAYKRLRVTGRTAVDGKEALVIQAQPEEGRPEQLYFDAASGLLLRIHTETTTPLGFVPEELTLADYAPAGGSMLPRTLRWERGDGQTTIALNTVTQ
jgi:hypothetical protein